ncbi:MAG: hypothetical protein IT214_05375 [Chitinophagaceae bacterium]|nr:hypothetical protein [Chitinophagaceae bacterium]
MYDQLYRLLILNKELNIPGIGNFSVNRKHAGSDFVEKLIYPPVYSITLQKDNGTLTQNFISSLAESLNIPDKEAIAGFNDFVFNIKQKLLAGEAVEWNGVGTLTMSGSGTIRLQAAEVPVIDEPVIAQKMIREHAEHTVLVGEKEHTSTEMTGILSQQETKKINWWMVPLIIGLLLLLLIIWQFFVSDWKLSGASNRQRIIPGKQVPSFVIPQ